MIITITRFSYITPKHTLSFDCLCRVCGGDMHNHPVLNVLNTYTNSRSVPQHLVFTGICDVCVGHIL